MNTYTRFILSASALAAFTSCQSYENMRNPQYDPMTGQILPDGTKVTPAYALENGQAPLAPQAAQTPSIVQPTAPTAQPQVSQPLPAQPAANPQPAQRKPVVRNTGPFSTPDVTKLPSKEDLKETETSTSNGSNSSGVTAPKR